MGSFFDEDDMHHGKRTRLHLHPQLEDINNANACSTSQLSLTSLPVEMLELAVFASCDARSLFSLSQARRYQTYTSNLSDLERASPSPHDTISLAPSSISLPETAWLAAMFN